MDNNDNAFGAFLASRRARLSPEQAGLQSGGGRRVPGLRRSEVAMLSGVSVEYVARLERGAVTGVSDAVLDALARALQLDDTEREHLTHLAQLIGGGGAPRRQQRRKQVVRESMQLVLDSITNVPAVIRTGRGDILATNDLGRALFSEMYIQPTRPVNHARFLFLDHRARRFYPEWDVAAADMVAILRNEAGRDPYDRALSDLVGELSTRCRVGVWVARLPPNRRVRQWPPLPAAAQLRGDPPSNRRRRGTSVQPGPNRLRRPRRIRRGSPSCPPRAQRL